MANFISNLIQTKKTCSVFALVGESGTGKSFRAKLLAEKYGITAIIDDGLLIQNDKILGGHSAKREKTYMGAVRVALFDDKEHRDEVAKALKKAKIKKNRMLKTNKRRDWDLNPGGKSSHEISSLAPYQARLSRHYCLK